MRTPISSGAVYSPETLRKAGEAFGSAWNCIRENFDAAARSDAQLKLATIVLQLAAEENCSTLELTCRAIGEMRVPPEGVRVPNPVLATDIE